MADTSSQRQSYGATGSSAPAGGDRQRTKSKGPAGASGGATSSSASKQPEQPVTKVEPKVWLASERTFFSWIRVALLLGSFALALFNGGDKIGSRMGMVYAIISIVMIVYAWYMHIRRSNRIRAAYAGNFDEPYGPVGVCVLLFAAVLANFIVRVKSHNGKMKPPKSPWLAAYMSYFMKLQDPASTSISYYDYDDI
ncbi:hypothetical protein P389DRAFT_196961 [Cystobasidium minutum MCA 4210]|uniref:uncharacterized protein n=1 Tax=Cystobasidium minutum MCA 4210 TaxID=1397322 RepID=UPI0034CDB39E|eukprot:jgi/Rhomi1/196961/gm1.5175_g